MISASRDGELIADIFSRMKFRAPKPFSKIIVRRDQPITVPRETNEQSFEELRSKLERHMLENQRQDDIRWGWGDII
jgi:lysophospholipid acyltransferase (LPLAT)-like uncharacterized protein